MVQPMGVGELHVSVDTALAEYGVVGVLSHLRDEGLGNELPTGYFGSLAQAFVRFGYIDASGAPTQQQKALLEAVEGVQIGNQEEVFSLLGAILDEQVDEFRDSLEDPEAVRGQELAAEIRVASPYVIGSYVLASALGVSGEGDDLQSRSLAAFRDILVDFGLRSHHDASPALPEPGVSMLDSLNFERLTAGQEVELAFSIEAGLFAQEKIDKSIRTGERLDPVLLQELRQLVRNGRRDKERFIRANIPLVLHWSKKGRFRDKGVRRNDLIQEGQLGLIQAVEKFDYKKGYKFSTYAAGWLDNAMMGAILDHGRTIRLPSNVGEELQKMRRVAGGLERELQRPPSDDEIARAMGMSRDRVVALKQWGRSTLSLNYPIGEGTELGEFISLPTREPEPAVSALAIDLEKAIGQLSEDDAKVIRAKFYESLSQGQVAERLGMTRGGVSYRIQRALRRLAETSPDLRQYLGRSGAY